MEEQLALAIALLERATGMKPAEIKKAIASKEAADAVEFEDMYEQGKAEALTKYRRDLIKKAKSLGVEGDLTKLKESEIIDKISSAAAESAKDDSEDVEALKLAHKNELKALEKKYNEDLESERQKIGNEAAKVRREAIIRGLLAKENFDIPEDEAVAKRRLNLALRDIESNNFIFDEKLQDYVLADENGDPIKDKGKVTTLANIATVSFEALYSRKAAKQKDGAQGGSGQGAQGGSGQGSDAFEFKHFKGEAPAKKEDYAKLITDPTLPLEARKEISEYWKAEQAKQAA